MDFYLNDKNVVKRLIEEWKKYGRLIVAYDFDSTVYDYHNKGDIFDVVNLIRKCKRLGFYLIVFTCNDENKYDFMRKYLSDNYIPFDIINQNAEFTPFNGRKIYYNILLDDRAGLSSAYNCLTQAINIIQKENKLI